MMRRYHRWLALLFGILLIWIAGTGLLSHGAALYRDAQPAPAIIPAAQAHEGELHNAATATPASAAASSTAAPAFTCPASMTCRPKPAPDSAAAWVSFFHHIHAGEEFGAIGTALSIASGLALLFFAFSGLYLYLELYRGGLARPARGDTGNPKRLFW
jgi:uncharacterized iron-regulated membrane protein